MRRVAYVLAKQSDEVRDVVYAHRLGYVLYAFARAEQQGLRVLYLLLYDVLQGCDAHRLSEIPYEIRLCKAGLVCKFLYRDGF